MMKCKELIEYLSRFGQEERVGFLVVNLAERVVYNIPAYQLLAEQPVILLETAESEPLDEVLEEVEPNERD